MLGGAAFIFFAYIGFDAVSTAAEEAKNPKRDLPIGIIGSLAICTVLYIIVVAILTGMVPYTHLNVPSPVAFAMDQVGMGWAGVIISLGAIAGLTTVLLVMMYGQTRVFFAMSRDGLLPADLFEGASQIPHAGRLDDILHDLHRADRRRSRRSASSAR